MKKIRIFISSPSDVQFERNIARKVINDLNLMFSEYVKLEVLMWEDFPLSASSTFQEGIDYFLTSEPIDIAVFILWSRLGTPLCSKFLKKDGTPYKSGTEYEFDLMMRLCEDTQHPNRILTYVKQDERHTATKNFSELRELIRQKDSLESFLKEYFRDEETNSNYAYLTFGQNKSFEQVFTIHVKNAIKDIIGEVKELKEWEGNPYVGLNSYEYEQQSIFWGRKQIVHDTASRLICADVDNDYKRSMIVLGASGSGKSSFVKAGLLPFFCNNDVSSYDYVIITPSMFAGRVYQGILDILVEKYAFLYGHPFIQELKEGITDVTNFNYLSYALDNNPKSDCILYIDQFEELFSDNQITEKERQMVLLLLRGLINTHKIYVFMSMRSDFYNRFSLYPQMTQIKEDCLLVDLPVMGITEITEIVEEPARKACLHWEIDDMGVGLNRRVIKDASHIKDLPLIEFALSELYLARNDKDVLTIKSYEQIGGLQGAIVNYANRIYSELNDNEKSAFEDILGFIVTESSSTKGTYVRKTSHREDVEKTPEHKSVIQKMLNARLFVAGKDANGKPTITVTHEVLLKSWPIIALWIEKEKDFITASRHYEQLSQHWLEHGKQKKDLVHGRSPLLEAEYFYFKNQNRLPDTVLEFLANSFKVENRSGLVWRIIVSAFISLSIITIFISRLLGIELGVPSLDDSTLLDLVLAYVPFLIIFYNSIYVRKKAHPKYKTIWSSLVIWAIAALMLLLFSCTNQPDFSNVVVTALIYFVPVFAYFVILLIEYIRRKRWKVRFVPHAIRDEFWSQFRSVSWAAIVCLVMLSAGMFYYLSAEEKNAALESRARVADELFEGLNNIRNRLSYEDNQYVNQMRQLYLVDNFADQLTDEEADERDLEYAKTLYNLKSPIDMLDFLHPGLNWCHHLYWIEGTFLSGKYSQIDELLAEYVHARRYDEIDNNFSTVQLIWRAELLGRFDFAQILDETVTDTLGTDYLSNPVNIINRSHILLHNGEIDQAMSQYRDAMIAGERLGFTGENHLKNNISNDLHLFSRFNVIHDDTLRMTAEGLGIQFLPAFVPLDCVNENESKAIFGILNGNWETFEDGNRICLNINAENKLLTYRLFDKDAIEKNTIVAECRLGRIDGDMYWDEFDPFSDANSYGKLLNFSDERFDLEIVYNSNSEDKGKIRTYTRVREEAL